MVKPSMSAGVDQMLSTGPISFAGLKISSAEDRVFEAILTEPRMSIAFGGSVKASTPNRLRCRDRVFARSPAFQNGISWLEICDVQPDGYGALVLTGKSQPDIVRLNLEGVGVYREASIAIEAVDDGIRVLPTEYVTATNAYLAFRELGVTTTWDDYRLTSRPKTNLIHVNAHRHAVVNLCFGQFFVAGHQIWVVKELLREGFVAVRMIDGRSSIFHSDGICIAEACLTVQAALLTEGEFDQKGWDYELAQHRPGGYPVDEVFSIAPGALTSARVGHVVVINLGAGLNASSWEIVGKTEEELVIASSVGLATLCLKTGVGSGPARGGQFLALVSSPLWVTGDPSAMVRKALLYA